MTETPSDADGLLATPLEYGELRAPGGVVTRELVRRADSVTVVDGSPTMLELNARVVFVDQDRRARGNETAISEGPGPTARRTLSDGRLFEIIKIFWEPAELEDRLRGIGWRAEGRPLGASFLTGTASSDGAAAAE